MEQLAFSPANLVPGIEPSPDKMLQGRLFSYNDTHRHRLGANYTQIPVNCPYRARAKNYQRDGPMTVDDNQVTIHFFTIHYVKYIALQNFGSAFMLYCYVGGVCTIDRTVYTNTVCCTVFPLQDCAPNYFPNSFSGPMDDRCCEGEPKMRVAGDVSRYNSSDEDNFTQVGIFYRKVSQMEFVKGSLKTRVFWQYDNEVG